MAPTAASLAWLWRHRVRWIVVDRRFGHEPSALGGLARLRMDNDDVAVYQLIRPEERSNG
jgi:hypothetical protein